jgi:thiol-disulfide isomerase/thioredoxin
MLTVFHPPARTLSAFALGETQLGDRKHRRVQRHLARCTACRSEVAVVRGLVTTVTAALDDAGAARPRDDALARILVARSRGESVILPGAPMIAPTRPVFASPAMVAAGVAAIAIAVVVWPWSARGVIAASSDGQLVFTPEAPTEGARIHVSYRPPETLARYDTLLLRARVRTPDDEIYQHGTRQVVAARLVRDGASTYTGSFDLPARAVYAAFAVENPAGDRIDANGGRLWDLLVRRGDKPSLAALEQQFNDVIDRSPDSALSIVRSTTLMYPDSPEAWGSRIAFESYMLGSAYVDSVLAEHRERFEKFDRALRSRPDVTADDMTGMHVYAVQIGDRAHPEIRAAATYWDGRLLADSSSSHRRGYFEISTFNSRVLRDSTLAPAALDSVERIWSRGDSLTAMTATFGMQIALRAGDTARVLRWVDRVVSRQPGSAVGVFEQIAARDSRLRPTAISRIQARVAELERRDDRQRLLGASVADDSLRRARDSRIGLAALGGLLAQAGDTAAALQALARATSAGWDLALFTRVANLYLATRDTAAAARAFALVASDPATSRAGADSLSRRFTGLLGADAWTGMLASARADLARRVRSESVMRKPLTPRTAGLVRADGTPADLAALIVGRVSVVVFWSRFCGASRMQLPLYSRLTADMTSHGVAFIPVAVEAPSADVANFLAAAKLDFPSFFDIRGEARRIFENNATPTYYVLDAQGRIRFEGHVASLALTQAVALQGRDE